MKKYVFLYMRPDSPHIFPSDEHLTRKACLADIAAYRVAGRFILSGPIEVEIPVEIAEREDRPWWYAKVG